VDTSRHLLSNQMTAWLAEALTRFETEDLSSYQDFRAGRLTPVPQTKAKTFWGVIPARQGSKRLTNKALRPVLGRPLIDYTLAQVVDSKWVSQSWVYTDDENLKEWFKTDWETQLHFSESKTALALTPFDRPAQVSDDQASSESMLQCLIQQFAEQNWLGQEAPDYLVLLQPTSPLRSTRQIDEAIYRFMESDADTLVSVAKPVKPLQWSCVADESGHLSKLFANPDANDSDSATLVSNVERALIPNGAIYIVQPARILAGEAIFSGRVLAYEMPFLDSVDVDTPEDLQLAEALLAQRLGSTESGGQVSSPLESTPSVQ
jgi:CMP-N,N'-diacetyllegionaminic acid synthase